MWSRGTQAKAKLYTDFLELFKLTELGPYGFCNVENANRIVEWSHKKIPYNVEYHWIMQNLNKSKQGCTLKIISQYGQWLSFIYCTFLIMRNACCVSASVSHYMRTWTHEHLQSCSESHFTRISPFHLIKLSYRNTKVFTTTHLKKKLREIYHYCTVEYTYQNNNLYF